MAGTIGDRINQYLEDTIAAERNFENALSSFGTAGEQAEVQQLLSSIAEKAKTRHQRLTALLERRGGSPSEAKAVLAQVLAFTPLTAQIGQGAGEKNTQHLTVTFTAAAAEMAMYDTLASAAARTGDQEVLSLARVLQREEHGDYRQVWAILPKSARNSFESEIAKGRSSQEIINDYLEDAIAAEKSFETQLTGFSEGETGQTARTLFELHARETKTQYQLLTSRLQAMGGSPSTLKSFLAHVFNFAPKAAQIGHDPAERLTQKLMMAYAVENAEVAMYEALAEACRAASDNETERLVLAIQQQEKATAEKLWSQLARTAQRALAA